MANKKIKDLTYTPATRVAGDVKGGKKKAIKKK
jgi:hypothetical protein